MSAEPVRMAIDCESPIEALAAALVAVEQLVLQVTSGPVVDRDEVRVCAGRLRLCAGDLEAHVGKPRGPRRARGPKGYADAGFRL